MRHQLATRIGPLVALVLVGALLSATAGAATETPATRVAQTRSVPVAVAVEASVEALSQAVVGAQVAGRIVEVRVDAGQAVKKGELLMRVDQREAVESAAGARATLINARAGFERAQNLQAQKFLSQAAVDKARAELDAAQAASDAALAAASHGRILSPISGVVALRHAEVGEMAVPGKALVTIHDPRGLRVSAAVTQGQLTRVRAAREAWIEIDSGVAGQPRRFAATGIAVLPGADPQTHTSTVRLGLPTEAAAFATPGMAARVHFVVGRAEKLTVPAGAILRRGEVAAVYVLAGSGAPALRQVRLGEAVADGEIEVLAGLASGERIALDPVKAGIRAGTGAKADLPAPVR